MPLPAIACNDFALAGTPCVRLPGGATLCFQSPGVVPSTPFAVGSAALAQVNSALAPLAPAFEVLETIKVITDTIKAVATLNPKEIAESLPALIKQVASLAALFPPASVPVFVVDILALLALVLDGLADELDAAGSYAAQLDEAAALPIATRYPDTRAAIECGRGHLSLVLEHLGGQVAPLNQLIGLVNGFLEIAGLEQFKLPCVAVLSASNLTTASTVFHNLASLLRTLAGQIPVPGNVPNKVVPC